MQSDTAGNKNYVGKGWGDINILVLLVFTFHFNTFVVSPQDLKQNLAYFQKNANCKIQETKADWMMRPASSRPFFLQPTKLKQA